MNKHLLHSASFHCLAKSITGSLYSEKLGSGQLTSPPAATVWKMALPLLLLLLGDSFTAARAQANSTPITVSGTIQWNNSASSQVGTILFTTTHGMNDNGSAISATPVGVG